MPSGDRGQRDRLRYAAVNFSDAVYALATGAGSIQQRLVAAHSCITAVFPEDVPEPLRERVRNLRATRARFPSAQALVDFGVRAVMAGRKPRFRPVAKREAAHMATEFWELWRLLEAENAAPARPPR